MHGSTSRVWIADRGDDVVRQPRARGSRDARRSAAVRVCWLILTLLVVVPGSATAQQSDSTARTAVPRIIAPVSDARLPRRDVDPPCPEAGPCPRMVVRGQVPPGTWPFLAVTPLAAAPRTWIQPPILAVQRNGVFESLAYLGIDNEGRGERFTIVVLACRDRQRFREGAIITELPSDCTASDPVTVVRTR